MNYQLVKQVRENNPLRKSFIDLAVKTFDLSFEEWYQQGYWTDAYIPYAFVERNKVIANASANIIDLRWQGAPRRYIQIGTVMTEPDHRNKGLAGQLIHHILQDWQQEACARSLLSILLSCREHMTRYSMMSVFRICRWYLPLTVRGW